MIPFVLSKNERLPDRFVFISSLTFHRSINGVDGEGWQEVVRKNKNKNIGLKADHGGSRVQGAGSKKDFVRSIKFTKNGRGNGNERRPGTIGNFADRKVVWVPKTMTKSVTSTGIPVAVRHVERDCFHFLLRSRRVLCSVSHSRK